MLSIELADLFSRDLTRLIEELRAFPGTAALWSTVPGVTNAAGTLTLHLEGNLREYIGRQLGQIAYTRDRQLEFSQRGVEQAELIERIGAVRNTIPEVVRGLTDDALTAPFPEEMFGKALPTRQVLLHLLGHFNYHLGQIDYLRRTTTGNGAIVLSAL